MLKQDEEWEFKTVSTSKFGGALIAYQIAESGSHRLAMVSESGEVLSAGFHSSYNVPCFARFGKSDYIGFSEYFHAESVLMQEACRLEYSLQTRKGA